MTSVAPRAIRDLAQLIREERDTLLESWRSQVRQLPSAAWLDAPTLDDHIPVFLTDVATALHAGAQELMASANGKGTPPEHGQQRVFDGYDIEEVVAEYGILRNCIFELASAHQLVLQDRSLVILNRMIDEAIGAAVGSFSKLQAAEVQRRRDEHLAFVAHDLRTPLHAIALCSRLVEHHLDEGHSKAAQVAQKVKTIHRNVRQLQELIDAVLSESHHLVADAEGGLRLERRTFDLWPLVEALADDLRPTADVRGTRLVNDTPDGLRIYADASVLRRVLQNLVANAIAHTAEGEVLVTAMAEADASVVCIVRDNGTGIPAEHLASVFEKHETQCESSGGLGLGLAIVRTMAEAHGGAVGVESLPGEGATFRVTFPGPASRS